LNLLAIDTATEACSAALLAGDELIERWQLAPRGHTQLLLPMIVDAATGTVRVKAQFDNREQRLWPGAFVGVRLAVRTLKDAVVVPQAAIVQSPRGAVVFVVEEGSRVAARPVQVLHAAGNDAAVQGLAGGERIVLGAQPGRGTAGEQPAAETEGDVVFARQLDEAGMAFHGGS